ncbi:rap1 GTPase-activating protein 1-like [Plakobranchus ocellatus]|uniref:Rap1 GTPase-activating protein 1-like n=1 Tax=Plakobranchus ocellatus TaxID=259542 RepID=A0AAV3ZCB9_9GAST|nr:rap1 GTPase-activating protein 1-like [Plakobranchus ocellatus]
MRKNSIIRRKARKQSMEGQLYCEAHAPESQNTTPSPETDERNTDLFEMLEKLQSTRIDDQRCDINTFFKELGRLPFEVAGVDSSERRFNYAGTNWMAGPDLVVVGHTSRF